MYFRLQLRYSWLPASYLGLSRLIARARYTIVPIKSRPVLAYAHKSY